MRICTYSRTKPRLSLSIPPKILFGTRLLAAHVTGEKFSMEGNRGSEGDTYRPKILTLIQSVATSARLRREKSLLRYALLQKRY